MKSAVYVMLIDAETERTIKKEGVEFELYGLDNALQILNTYYPHRISYRMYETTEEGTFYFPEKLVWGEYELHELTEPEGYDAAENVPFVLDALYDWPEPLVVRVPVHPSRNIIRVQMTDRATALPVSSGSFEVVAAENIITSDGTLRYRTGQVACEIKCDETGYGESEEIYLGNYYLRQKDIPDFYAGILENMDVTVEKKSNVLPELLQIACDRTTINVKVADELYPTRGISKAAYRVSIDRSTDDPIEISTNTSGEFILNELRKGVTYRIRQTEPASGYQEDKLYYTVTINANGRINGEPETDVQITNRMIRVQIGITDEFSSIQVPGVNLALFDSTDTLIRTWVTTGTPLLLNNLSIGRYYLVRDGDTDTRYDIDVRDTAEIQSINLNTTYLVHYLIFGGMTTLLLIVVISGAVLIRKRLKKAKE